MEEQTQEIEKPKKAKKEKAPKNLYYNGEISTEPKSKKDIVYMQQKDYDKTINKIVEDFRGLIGECTACIKSKVQNEKIKNQFDSIVSKYKN